MKLISPITLQLVEMPDNATSPITGRTYYGGSIPVEVYVAAGLGLIPVPAAPVAEGYVRLSSAWLPDGLGNAVETVVDMAQADYDAQQEALAAQAAIDAAAAAEQAVLDAEALAASIAAARLASFQPLIPHAASFRFLMRQYFGDEAETNREITREVVESYFLTAPDLTVQDVQRGMMLRGLFEELAAWNGTGETWSLPWEIVPS